MTPCYSQSRPFLKDHGKWQLLAMARARVRRALRFWADSKLVEYVD